MMKEPGKRELNKLKKEMPELPEYKYTCHCMECEHEWETNEEYDIQSYCPYCLCGDIKYIINGEE